MVERLWCSMVIEWMWCRCVKCLFVFAPVAPLTATGTDAVGQSRLQLLPLFHGELEHVEKPLRVRDTP